jgi:hypothetical protein
MIPTKKTTDTSQTMEEEALLERPLAFLGGQIPLWNVPSKYPCKIFSRSLCHWAQCIIGLGIVNTGPASSKKARSVCVVWFRDIPTTNLPTIIGLGSDLFVL